MGKAIPEASMDAMLSHLAGSTRMDVVSDTATPGGLSGSLAHVSMAGGDFAISQGDGGTGSRKMVVAAKAGVSVAVAGTPKHVCLSHGGGLRLVTTCTGPDLTVGSTTAFPSWKYELGILT